MSVPSATPGSIHDQTYRRYAGRREPFGRMWRVIARNGIAAVVRERRFIGLLLIAWAPFVVRAVQIYVASSVPQATFLAATSLTYQQFLAQQAPFVFFITIYAGAGLIAEDRRAHALQIYLSKPISRVEYITGKFIVLFSFLLSVTMLPALLLLMLQAAFTGTAFLRAYPGIVPAIVLVSGIETIVATFTVLALSSLSRSRRFVSIMYAGIVFFSTAVAGAARGLTGSPISALASPPALIGVVSNAVFRRPQAQDIPVAAALLMLAAIVGAALMVLERRVRGVEVVA